MNNFTDFNLSDPLMKAITDLGFTTPSAIQTQALPILLDQPTDFIGLAATGTGKTAAFGIPLIEKIVPSKKSVQGLILCPTRELALQVAGQIDLLGKYRGIRAVPIYGGASYSQQFDGLKQGHSVVVGTPGRIIDHLERGTLKLQDVKVVILDEADEMISMGFKEDLETILKSVPKSLSHTWLFSATMSPDIKKVADKYLNKYKQIQINQTSVLPSSVDQVYYNAKEADKPDIICKLIDHADSFYGLIFCQTKSLTINLTDYLSQRGYKADCLHGDKSQNSREVTLNSFRSKKIKILVCTDVASRGIDVKDVTHVINFSIPRELDSYVHRIGRTARSGKSGIAMSLVTPAQRQLLTRVERMTKTKIREGKIPSSKEIGTKKIASLLPQFKEQNAFSKILPFISVDWMEAFHSMSSEEIAARFIALYHPEFCDLDQKSQMAKMKGYSSNESFRAENQGKRSSRKDKGSSRGRNRAKHRSSRNSQFRGSEQRRSH
ncbi:MAG: DEAD/DEAH box helicase [Bdellovibrionales bacterium]|nr:DEAD/DEAH box helicase [Bdellovibrionales bacterium]